MNGLANTLIKAWLNGQFQGLIGMIYEVLDRERMRTLDTALQQLEQEGLNHQIKPGVEKLNKPRTEKLIKLGAEKLIIVSDRAGLELHKKLLRYEMYTFQKRQFDVITTVEEPNNPTCFVAETKTIPATSLFRNTCFVVFSKTKPMSFLIYTKQNPGKKNVKNRDLIVFGDSDEFRRSPKESRNNSYGLDKPIKQKVPEFLPLP
ncbi:hypothetical protein YC2023_017072 [Brassica napus]